MENQDISNNNTLYDFKSITSIDEKDYQEFCNMNSFRLFLSFLLWFFVALAISISYNIKNYNMFLSGRVLSAIHLVATLLLSVLMIVIYCKYKNTCKNSFKRTLFISSGRSPVTEIYFAERIFTIQNNNRNAFDYASITAIYEGTKYYYLKLQYNLYLTVNKNLASNLSNVDFISYILSKSPDLKNKSLQKSRNYKRLAFIIMCITISVFIINIAITAIYIISIFINQISALY